MKTTRNPPLWLGLFVGLCSLAACTETSKEWRRDDTPGEVVDRQKHLCKVWADQQVPWRTGLSGDEKDEIKGRADVFFRECMTLNGFKEKETVEYK